jgi:hypothetical protein
MFLLVNDASEAIHAAQNSTPQKPPGFSVVVVPGNADTYTWPNGGATRCKYAGGAIVGDPTYADVQAKIDRAASYAPVEDQLDMMYWDSVNGTRIWLDHIAAVKAKHPKPE